MTEEQTQVQSTERIPDTLSTAVLLRGLGEEEVRRLMGIYRANRKNHYRTDRVAYLSQEISEQEKAFLIDYLNTRLTMRELCGKHNIPHTSGHHKLQRIMAHYRYQNRESIS